MQGSLDSEMIFAKPTFVAPEIKNVSTTTSVKKSRCMYGSCRVKLGLTSFPCRCGNLYCPSHRHSESHECTYDFKSEQSQKLTSELIKVSGTKLDRL
jgi:hypothetical protein